MLSLITYFLILCPITGHSELIGAWETQCQLGLRKTQLITNTLFSETMEHFYQDKDCLSESFRFKSTGQLYLSETPNWVDFSYNSIELTVFVPSVVVDFNKRKVCGYTNWQVGMSQVITGLWCAIFNYYKETQIALPLDMKYGIYSIMNEKLYFGQLTKAQDGSSPEKRPQIYNPEFYKKIRSELL